MMVLRDFATNELTAERLEPVGDVVKGEFQPGYRPLAIRGGETTAIYYPTGGTAEIASGSSSAQWFDPRTGGYQAATGAKGSYEAPAGVDETGRPLDYVLLLKR
jgi:hypothetical protein